MKLNQTILRLQYSDKAKQKLSNMEKQFYRTWDDNIASYLDCSNRIYSNGNETKKKVALTFDDAPDTYCTPKILDILKKLNVKASFSVVGLHIEENKSLLKRIFEEEHTIINHTYKHYDLTSLSSEELYDEIIKTEDLIYDLTGVKPSIIRPPYGKLSLDIVKNIADMDYDIVLWSHNTCDWVAENPDDILDNMYDSIRPGEIILLHSYENKEPTVEALESLILSLQEREFEIVPIESLLNIQCYH